MGAIDHPDRVRDAHASREQPRARAHRARVWLPFEVARFEDGHAWSWRVGGILATGHRVEPLGPSRCRVVFELPALALPYAVSAGARCDASRVSWRPNRPRA